MKEFDAALSNFVREFASGGAIRHYVELEYSVAEIKSTLDFSVSINEIAALVWQEYINTKVICENKDDIDKEYITKTEFVKDYNKYGKTSLRKVTNKVEVAHKDYIPCDFGQMIYQDREAFIRGLDKLPQDVRDMIEYLPWPYHTVYVDSTSRLGQAVSKFDDNR